MRAVAGVPASRGPSSHRAASRLIAAIAAAALAAALVAPARARAERVPDPGSPAPAYDNTLAKDFVMDAPWRVVDANTPIPISIVIKDCDVDDVRELHWIRAWDVTGGGSTLLWDHNFGDERIGNDATEKKYWTYITTVTEGHPSLPNGTLLTPANLGYGAGAAIQLKVSVYYRDDFFNYTENRYLRVRVGGGAFPWPTGWYGGDTHVHTMYTNNIAEFGAPIPATRRAAAAIGMHWMTITDHSCDLDETGDGTWSYATLQWEYTLQTPSGIQTFTRDNVALGGTWAAIGADVAEFGGPDLRLERGVEINLASIDADTPGKTLHTLFVNPFYIDSPWCGTITERPVFPTVPNGLAQLAPGGFAFAAHPLSDLAAEFGGLDFAVNGARWGDQDVTVALGYEAFRGFQAFNTRDTRFSSDQENPWADFDAGVAPGNAYPGELLQGIALWDARLRANVGTAGAQGIPPRKIFFTGGSDAHGDFNYATHLSTDTYATDNALGKVQTVVHVPGAFPGQYAPGNLPPADSIMAAYRAGRAVATDGPFLEIGLDRDDDGDWYEPGDLRIGDDGVANPGAALPLRVRWASLAEFGAITNVTVFAGDATSTAALLTIDPASIGQGYAGATTLDLGAFALSGAVYVRAECLTSDGAAGHRAYTNPIWIAFDAATDVAGGGDGRGGEDGGVGGDGAGDFGADGRALTPNGAPLWLGACAPNPFRAGGGGAAGASSATAIPFALARDSRVTLAIFDAQGRRVRALLGAAPRAAGRHAASWDGRDESGAPSPAGIYFVLVRAGDADRAAQRLVLLR